MGGQICTHTGELVHHSRVYITPVDPMVKQTSIHMCMLFYCAVFGLDHTDYITLVSLAVKHCVSALLVHEAHSCCTANGFKLCMYYCRL